MVTADLSLWISVEVSPTPELLIGFDCSEEAADVQQFLLTAPSAELEPFMSRLFERTKRGEVVYIEPANPEQPREVTAWHSGHK